jgi:hypothetical protein
MSWMGRLIDHAGDESRFVAGLQTHFNRALMHGLYNWNLHERKVEFRIPKGLSDKWGLVR